MQLRFPRIRDAKDHILTACILLLSVSLMIARNQDGLHTLRTASITIFSYLEEPLSSIRIYRKALKTNADLRRQNILLLDELSRRRAAAQELKKLRQLLEFEKTYDLPLQPVKIVGKELTGIHNYLTVDSGTKNGVKRGMPLVTENGLAGKVIFVSKQYAQIMPYASTLFRVSAQIQESRAYGIVSWDGETINSLTMQYVPQTVDADSGQIVVTSGFSNEFPPNIPIGTIEKTVHQTGSNTQFIYLKPLVDLSTTAEGFIIKFEPDSARRSLNNEYQESFN